MQYTTYERGSVTIRYSTFGKGSSTHELHAVATVADASRTFTEQLDSVAEALAGFCSTPEANGYQPIVARLLLSDAANQAEQALERFKDIFPLTTYIQQPPLNGTKIAVVAYYRTNAEVKRTDSHTIAIESNGLTHLWSAMLCGAAPRTYTETTNQLDALERTLKSHGGNIADNCVRTWFFVQNIDVNYSEVVRARREYFNEHGLTEATHYIASTGIGGRHADRAITSVLEAYSVVGLRRDQVKYLYASDHMNRTSDYGVTFERGTAVDYADRRHIFVSGTASIDNKGQVVCKRDIKGQTARMIENVTALLNEAGATFANVAHCIVYLRDTADYRIVNETLRHALGNIPYVIVLAPVCRPEWLIEMECMAIAGKHQ